MNRLILLVLFVSAFSFGNSPYVKRWTSRQCRSWSEDLSLEEARGRVEWARVCASEFETYYRYAEKIAQTFSGKKMLSPVFGSINEDEVITNPRRYRAPVVVPKNEKDCDLPSDYTLVGMCESIPDL